MLLYTSRLKNGEGGKEDHIHRDEKKHKDELTFTVYRRVYLISNIVLPPLPPFF